MTRVRTFALTFLAGASGSLALCSTARANDAMFPAQSAAAASIAWKNNYFTINGKPTVINAGEIHYARVPRELWHDRLVKMKRAGLNTISTYSF
jgi:beta-galactosidase